LRNYRSTFILKDLRNPWSEVKTRNIVRLSQSGVRSWADGQ